MTAFTVDTEAAYPLSLLVAFSCDKLDVGENFRVMLDRVPFFCGLLVFVAPSPGSVILVLDGGGNYRLYLQWLPICLLWLGGKRRTCLFISSSVGFSIVLSKYFFLDIKILKLVISYIDHNSFGGSSFIIAVSSWNSEISLTHAARGITNPSC